MMANEKSPSGDSEAGNADNTERKPARRVQPGSAGSARGPVDGRRSSDALKRNQERLGVGSDHRTEAMKKGKRGTFP